MEKYLHDTILKTAPRPPLPISEDEDARMHGRICDVHLDYDTYRKLCDLCIEKGKEEGDALEMPIHTWIKWRWRLLRIKKFFLP